MGAGQTTVLGAHVHEPVVLGFSNKIELVTIESRENTIAFNNAS